MSIRKRVAEAGGVLDEPCETDYFTSVEVERSGLSTTRSGQTFKKSGHLERERMGAAGQLTHEVDCDSRELGRKSLGEFHPETSIPGIVDDSSDEEVTANPQSTRVGLRPTSLPFMDLSNKENLGKFPVLSEKDKQVFDLQTQLLKLSHEKNVEFSSAEDARKSEERAREELHEQLAHKETLVKSMALLTKQLEDANLQCSKDRLRLVELQNILEEKEETSLKDILPPQDRPQPGPGSHCSSRKLKVGKELRCSDAESRRGSLCRSGGGGCG